MVETIGIEALQIHSLRSAGQTEKGGPVPGIGPLPAHVYHIVSDVALNSDQLAIFGVTSVAAVLLWYVLQRTKTGLDMRAVVDRSSSPASAGSTPPAPRRSHGR